MVRRERLELSRLGH